MPELVTSGVPILGASLWVLALLFLFVAVGRRILSWCGVRSGPLAPRAIASAALGAGALQFLPFGLGATGMLSVTSLRIGLAIVASLAARDLWSVGLSAVRLARTRSEGTERWLLVWLALLVPAVAAATALALAPTIDPDGLSYHLTVPKRWLASGWLGYLPTYPYSNTPMGGEMLFAIGLALGGDAVAKMIHLALGLSGAVGLYLAGTRLRGTVTGAAASTLYLVGPTGVVALLGAAYVEGITSFVLIASVLAWIVWFCESEAAWLRAAALLSGFSVSFKLTAAICPLALVALTVFVIRDERHSASGGARGELPWPLLALVALPVLPWLARAWMMTGNPVFPIFAHAIPSRDLTAAQAKLFDDYNRYMLWGGRFGASWPLERRRLILVAFALGVVVSGGFLWTRLRDALARKTLTVLVLVVLAQTAAVGLYGRYWIPLVSVLQLPLLAWLETAASSRAAPRWILAFAALLSLFQTRSMLGSVGNDVKGLATTVLGLSGPRDFLTNHVALFPAYELANRDLPQDSGILLCSYCGGFYLDRKTFCAEFVQNSLRFTTWEEFTADMSRLGISHVLAPRVLAEGGPRPPIGTGSVSALIHEREYDLVSRLLTERGRLLIAADDEGLYAVGPAK